MNEDVFVDLCFPLIGEIIPADSSYFVYSALSKLLPDLHHSPEIGIFSINGFPNKNRTLSLTPKSQLKLRLPTSKVSQYLTLAGQKLNIDSCEIKLKGGYQCSLIPTPRLYSRLVIIKGYMESDSFLTAASKQLKELNIQGEISLIPQFQIEEKNRSSLNGTHSSYLRRTLQIKHKAIVGYAVLAHELMAEESILLQEKGLGGRRHFGCGLFVPERR